MQEPLGGCHIGNQPLGVVPKTVGEADHVHNVRQVAGQIVFERCLAPAGIVHLGDQRGEIGVW